MPDRTFLAWPFFEPPHRALADALDAWARREVRHHDAHAIAETDRATIDLVRRLGAGGWLKYAVPSPYGGNAPKLDVRSLCLIRETLARHDG
ncbi:MAG: acyl-CoA dehydrogenase family protein, partial [Candidatus Odyssella sp.]|nr:acyl-CoA dehydrogenase family protein [Candidatus Odyssella sp.]